MPFVALPYASKVTGLLQDLNLRMPPLRDVNTGRLVANIDRSWDGRENLRRNIHERLPALQERARETNRLLVAADVVVDCSGDEDIAARSGARSSTCHQMRPTTYSCAPSYREESSTS
ncbi:MAG: hypothetical protein ACREV3_00385 [Gammaproteobacteria bacterium]